MECQLCGKPLDDQSAYCAACGTRNEQVEEHGDYVYEAFISYRHLPKDKAVARRVQRVLEGFRIPKHLRAEEDDAAAGDEAAATAPHDATPVDFSQSPVQSRTNPNRLGKLFRDEDELPASDSLPGQIERALKQSRYLIVVCSPQTRESLWVMKEVEQFAALHGRHRIMVALADGEPSESFPPLLLTQSVKMQDGSVVETPAEPLAADLRSTARRKFPFEMLRLAAPLIGCGYDDLRQRRRAASVRNALLLAAIISAVSLTFGIVSYRQQVQIQKNYREMQVKESEVLAQRSAQLLAQGDRYEAIQVALAALPADAHASDRPFVPVAQKALVDALGVYPQQEEWVPCYSVQTCSGQLAYRADHVWFGDNGLGATLSTFGEVQVLDTMSGELACSFNAEELLGIERDSTTIQCGVAFAGERLIVAYRACVGCFDATDGTLLWSYRPEGDYYACCPYDVSVAVSPDSKCVAFFGRDSLEDKVQLSVVAIEDGSLVRAFEMANPQDKELPDSDPMVTFDSDGSNVYVGCWGSVFKADLTTGEMTSKSLRFGNVDSLSFAEGRLVVISYSNVAWVSDNQIALETFDSSLELLWDRSEPYFSGFDAAGIDYSTKTGVIGTWDYYRNGSLQYVTLFGRKLLFLDAETGKEEFALDCNTTFVGGAVLESRGRERIFACTSVGEVLCRVPYSSNDGMGGMLHDERHDIGSLQEAVFVNAGGHTVLSVMPWTEDRRVVYRFSQNDDYPDDVPINEMTESLSEAVWNDSATVVRAGTNLLFLDPSSLEVRQTISLDGLVSDGSIEGTELSQAGDLYFAGSKLEEADDDTFTIFRATGDAAEVEELITLEGRLRSSGLLMVDVGETGRLVLNSYHDFTDWVVSLDPSDPQGGETLEVNLDELLGIESWSIYTLVPANDKVLVISEDNSATAPIYLLDVATGKLVDSDVSSYEVSSSIVERQVGTSSTEPVLALQCADNIIRVFDTRSGSLLWESDNPYDSVRVMRITREGNVFLQDAGGSCFLLDGGTGAVIRSTSEALPPIIAAFQVEGSDTVCAVFRETGGIMGGDMGIVLLSLDEDAFGPLSILYGVDLASSDCQWFLYEDSYSAVPHRARLLTLDELIDLAHATVEGHELNEAQRQLYGIS